MGKLMTHLWFLASLLQNLHHGCNHTLHLVLPKSSMVLQHHCTLNSPKYPKSPCSVSKSRSATKDGARRTRWSQDFHHATDNRGPSFLPFLSLKTWLSGIPVNGPTILEIFSIKSYQINHLVYGVPNFDPYALTHMPQEKYYFHPTWNSTPGILLRAFKDQEVPINGQCG